MATRDPLPSDSLPRNKPLQDVEPPRTSVPNDTPIAPSSRDTNPLTNLKRSSPFQFGSRYLEASDDVFDWNAWDHVDPSQDETFINFSTTQYAFQKANPVPEDSRFRFLDKPESWWNKFYGNNSEKFFKDRKWLRQEFPVLNRCLGRDVRSTGLEDATAEENAGDDEDDAPRTTRTSAFAPSETDGPFNTVLEIGAGAGNTAFPLVKANQNPNFHIHAVDFSKTAVQVMLNAPQFSAQHMSASTWDMASIEHPLPENLSKGSIDVVMLIFAFSALEPKQWCRAIRNVYDALRPGGYVCLRDYGRGDLAQVRFKKGRLLSENFYIRGDGTRVYFFEEEQLRRLWSGEARDVTREVTGESEDGEVPRFEILNLAADRRLLVNRQRKLKMYRCWMQGFFRKPLDDETGLARKLEDTKLT